MLPLEVTGDPPALAGQTCEAFLCEQFWYEGVLEAPANVTHLCFAAQWYRLYFDCGIIFWRSGDEGPDSWAVPEEGWDYPLVDVGAELGIVGVRLLDYCMEPTERGSRVTFRFENGHEVRLEDVDDHTGYSIIRDART